MAKEPKPSIDRNAFSKAFEEFCLSQNTALINDHDEEELWMSKAEFRAMFVNFLNRYFELCRNQQESG